MSDALRALDHGGPVYLRPLEEADRERTHRWHNDRALYATLGGSFRLVSNDREEEWIRARAADASGVAAAICLASSDAHVGNVYLRGIDWIARRAEVHLFLADPAHRGQGYGTHAVRLIVEHAFRDLGLQRVHLEVLASNAVARRLYASCGFVEEGCLRGHAFKDGTPEDVIVMGRLRGDPAPATDDA